jgi:hypothetical protein
MNIDLTYRTLAVALAATLAAAVPAVAQDFAPPQGCEGVLTIQSRSCLVIHTWTCAADAPGEQWMALFTQRGPFNVRKVDAEFQWLETYFAEPPAIETMLVPAPDPASITVLLAEDLDTYDFTVSNDRGTPDERVTGFDSLTGETVEIDGEPLLRTEFQYEVTLPDGTVQYRGAGAQFLSERHRMFLLGLSWEQDTPDDITDASPVEFIYPGEPGFFSTRPEYDCGVLSKAPR